MQEAGAVAGSDAGTGEAPAFEEYVAARGPEVRADGVPVRAAAVRRRRVVAAGAALAVASVVVGGLAVRGSGGEEKVANDVPADTTAPYDVPACPARLPDTEEANRVVPDLEDVVAIRRCPDLLGWGGRAAPHPADVALLDDQDALVHDLDGFREAVAAIPTGTPEICLSASVINDRRSLMLIRADGTSTLVWTPSCQTIRVAGRKVEGSALSRAFIEALSRQRDELDYSRPFQGELRCDSQFASTPAVPGREHLVAAIFCSAEDDHATPLDSSQLADLRTAWGDPQVPVERLDAGNKACVEGEDASTYILASTDRSDVERLYPSPCGYLKWTAWGPGQRAAIPITLEELGLR